LKTLALFDFDGTVTNRDSLIQYIRFSKGDLRTLWGMIVLSPVLFAYKLKIIPNYRAKEKMLIYFFADMSEKKFKGLAQEYALTHIDKIIRPKALECILSHKHKGHRVIIISASIECWIKPWCDKHDIELIATQLEIVNNHITGKLSTKNCYGQEKVNRVKKFLKLDIYNTIYVYGDSRGDRELLALGNKKFYKPFRK